VLADKKSKARQSTKLRTRGSDGLTTHPRSRLGARAYPPAPPALVAHAQGAFTMWVDWGRLGENQRSVGGRVIAVNSGMKLHRRAGSRLVSSVISLVAWRGLRLFG
jgi:hypothetical protein